MASPQNISDSEAPAGNRRERFLVFGAPLVGEPEIAEVEACLRSGWLGTGPRVAQFEREFAAYVGVDHAIAVNSCTAALHLSLLAAGVGAGDEVITTAMTFCATVNAIIHSGATPVIADCEPVTMNIDPADIERRITDKTRAIVVVHFAGRACNMTAISAIAAKHNLQLIEDCAHAIETEYQGRKAGTFGDFACFSFYVTKNVMTGEGGMVVTRRAEDAEKIKVLALHGMSKDAWKRFGDEGYKHYDVVECGFKYNMMDIQAALGIHQLRRVEECWRRRQEVWTRYNQAFAASGLKLPAPPEPDTRHAYHLYTVLVDGKATAKSRDAFMVAMTRENIGVGVHYRSIAEHPYYQKTFGWKPEDYPCAFAIGQRTVSLPFSAALSDNDLLDVESAVARCLA